MTKIKVPEADDLHDESRSEDLGTGVRGKYSHRQSEILDFFHTIDYDPEYDPKAQPARLPFTLT